MDCSQLSPSRQAVFQKSLALVDEAMRTTGVVLAAHEAARLYREHPDCGLSEVDIRENLVQIAIEQRLAIDTSR